MTQKKRATGKSSKKKTTKNKKKPANLRTEVELSRRREITALVMVAVGVFLALAIQFSITGIVGTAIGDFLKGCFGVVAYILPYYLIVYGILLFLDKIRKIKIVTNIFLVVLFFSVTVLNAIRMVDIHEATLPILGLKNIYQMGIEFKNGGVFGHIIATGLVKVIGVAGAYILSIVVIIISLMVVINRPLESFVKEADPEAQERKRQKKADRKEAKLAAREEQKRRKAMMKKEEVDARKAQLQEDYDRRQYSETYQRPERYTSYRNYETPKSTIKALKKARLAENQKNIMNYMCDDSLFNTQSEDIHEVSQEDVEKAFETILEAQNLQLEAEETVGFSDADRTDESEIVFEKDDRYWQGYDSDQATDIDWGHDDEEEDYEDVNFSDVSGYDSAAGRNMGNMNDIKDSGSADEPDEVDALVDARQEEQRRKTPALTNTEARNSSLEESEINLKKPEKPYSFPPISLLKNVKKNENRNYNAAEKAAKLESTLKSFNVNAKVVNVTQGPAVTRYEIHPDVGVKVSSIVRLADDIALNLEAKSIRIEAPIPGKAAVGIEVENDKINMVTLREIIESKEFKAEKSKIAFSVGRDIAGNSIVTDLAKMPHLLIAGSTGSGKSVCINSIIASILYRARPEEVKLILIDPKVVELGNYNGIPHLLIPVVTDPAKAAAALNWAVAEMDRRYNLIAEAGARKLSGYNDYLKKNKPEEEPLPEIVIIIDELADLMMTAPSQVEESICRLAQKARAAGMHIIVATQRPSVDIITGVIKSNIPSRIAFAVSSQFDSRTILDMAGAEKLVGNGDMLFNPLGKNKPLRVQGSFISDEEVSDVIDYVKNQAEGADYSENVIQEIEKPATAEKQEDKDELYEDAIEVVVNAGQASVSMLQRRFRIGYNRAARIIDLMEDNGIIGPSDGSRPRQVYMTEEQLMQRQGLQNGDAPEEGDSDGEME